MDSDDAPTVEATTGQKTYRHLRLSLVFLVGALVLSILVVSAVESWHPLRLGWRVYPSISHYYFTPAHDVFVGALIATSVALLALAGRGHAPVLLDLAGVFAPLIALVPTSGIGVIPNLACGSTTECLPDEYVDDAKAGVAVYAISVIAIVVIAAVIRVVKKQPTTRGAWIVSIVACATAVGVAVLAFVPGVDDRFPFNVPTPFLTSIHFVATVAFFLLIASVALFESRERRDPGEAPPTPRQRVVYRVIAIGLAAVMLALVAVLALSPDTTFPLIFTLEALALALFAWFWWVQTFQRLDEPDPRYLAPPRG